MFLALRATALGDLPLEIPDNWAGVSELSCPMENDSTVDEIEGWWAEIQN